jgi:transketolase
VFITVDQQTGFDSELQTILGKRFIIEAISEQSVTGFASGLASEGFIPIVFNHAAFSIRRSYEQILLDCCLQERKVIFLAMGGGYATAHLGPSHTTFDDIALARVMPNMDVFVPAGSNDVNQYFEQLVSSANSVYVRLSKYGKFNLEGFQAVGNAFISYRKYGSGTSENKPVAVVSTGPISVNVSAALELLSEESETNFIQVHIPFVKPFDTNAFCELTRDADELMIFEEHSIIGGLGAACIEALCASGERVKMAVKQFGINDIFIHNYGSQEEIWEHLGLDKFSIIDSIKAHTLKSK